MTERLRRLKKSTRPADITVTTRRNNHSGHSRGDVVVNNLLIMAVVTTA